MFAKDKVSQSMIDAVKNIVEAPETVEENEKVKTSTGMKVYGSSYGNSERARREQLKRPVDATKGPNKKELASMAKEKNEEINFGLKDKLIEALKGKQTKLDKNHNNKLDAQDFAILRGQKNEEVEDVEEAVQPADVPAYLRKAKGEKPLSLSDVKGPRKDSISHSANLALNRSKTSPGETVLSREEVEELDEKHMTDSQKAEQERIVKGMKKGFAGFRKRYGERAKSVMYATATKQAMHGEEIDPKVRTKDTITGRKPTDQDNDVGRGSDFKSTKVKFRGGPLGEGKRPETDNVPFEQPYQKVTSDVITDKSGAKHTPMSRARDLARSAMKKIKTEMLGKAPGNNG